MRCLLIPPLSSRGLHHTMRHRWCCCPSLSSCRRSLSTCTPAALQRFASSAGRGSWSSSSLARPSSSPTFRPPTQNLLSPFGSVLHGPTRAPQATFAEPLDTWLAVLADTVPFNADCLLVCPSTSTRAQVKHVWDRCRAHMPTAHVGTLHVRNEFHGQCATSSPRKRSGPAEEVLPSAPPPHSTAGTPPEVGSSVTSSSLAPSSVVHVNASSSALSRRTARHAVPTRPLPALRSPLEGVAPSSLDVVVFASNVFAHEMLLDAPWHLSMAHRALRPHGVVAIVGHVADAEVVAPDWAMASCADCVASVHGEAMQDLELAALEAVRAVPSCEAHVHRLRRALEIQETLRTAHGDVFFPFPSVKCRWFTSEYAMTPAQVTASYRAAPLYQALYGLAGATWRRTAQYALHHSRHHRGEGNDDAHGSNGADDDFFVDLTGTLTNDVPGGMEHGRVESGASLSHSSLHSTEDLASSWSPLGVQRRRGIVDPLDALQAILEAHAGGVRADADPRSPLTRRPPRSMEPPLRVQMRHFVVTCSSRSINAPLDAPQPPRLPGTVGHRGGGSLLSSACCSKRQTSLPSS
ncbi:hypothetical protein ABB37_00432 [Leptomonas pyrrhocoris]|uniref:Uncharacterized protein n=1 Tax=Leptomonas pyrrhocoris TaxID=157538 RepID=A0A0M9GAG3_LEPPY|nr:hypothetical protein ABB37_00432 [Leptomonas pyrrhocoris]KPA86187.1 hypothetical protein ABB37_00432 [Leptomonas pyrrhocoris]|eukprot:XP_015664626.1 hypothetical protein ABB37_00432 [Leptomonas pyrrhocoris]